MSVKVLKKHGYDCEIIPYTATGNGRLEKRYKIVLHKHHSCHEDYQVIMGITSKRIAQKILTVMGNLFDEGFMYGAVDEYQNAFNDGQEAFYESIKHLAKELALDNS